MAINDGKIFNISITTKNISEGNQTPTRTRMMPVVTPGVTRDGTDDEGNRDYKAKGAMRLLNKYFKNTECMIER